MPSSRVAMCSRVSSWLDSSRSWRCRPSLAVPSTRTAVVSIWAKPPLLLYLKGVATTRTFPVSGWHCPGSCATMPTTSPHLRARPKAVTLPSRQPRVMLRRPSASLPTALPRFITTRWRRRPSTAPRWAKFPSRRSRATSVTPWVQQASSKASSRCMPSRRDGFPQRSASTPWAPAVPSMSSIGISL